MAGLTTILPRSVSVAQVVAATLGQLHQSRDNFGMLGGHVGLFADVVFQIVKRRGKLPRLVRLAANRLGSGHAKLPLAGPDGL